MLPCLALVLAAAPPIDVDSILREMPDLRRLAHRPNPWYKYVQSTSYDRASDNWKDPFANGDAGQFLRTEDHDGRHERVMADVKGPGAMVRLWSANPVGTIRFYFDGETTPRLQGDMAAMLSGRNPLFPEPFSYMASSGANLFFPLPYARGLKVTWEGPSNVALYYAVGTRAYTPGTAVTTFTPASLAHAQKTMDATAKALFPNPSKAGLSGRAVASGGVLAPGATQTATFHSGIGGAIDEFAVKIETKDEPEKDWTDPARLHNRLRQARLRMSFDGETTVDVPLGDFFGSPVAGADYSSLPITVEKDGTMICRWSMPFRRDAKIWIENEGPLPLKLTMGTVTANRLFTEGTYLFHARWHSQTRPTMPRYDFTYLNAKGEGRVVGVGLLVSNPVRAWWGEGDEKVYVDGETFPSLFGTGTEDYFGYAWSNPAPFAKPYHAQPPTPNLGNQGQTENLRFHIVDDIPYRKDIRFDMEAWHWANVVCTYATTAFWYALPGTTTPEPLPKERLIPDAPLPKPVKGAIEGEKLSWSVTSGETEMQSGFPEISGATQFWWREPQVGATATTSFEVKEAGRYELFANLGHAVDYGRFRILVNGQPAKEVDLYQDNLEWRRESLGTFDLPVGRATIRFEALEANPKSDPGKRMLGVDYFLLEKR